GAVATSGQIDVDHHVPALGGDLYVLAAGGDPLHRSPELQGEVTREDVLRRGATLGPEAAADVGRDHPHVVRLEAESPRQVVLHPMRRLRRHPHGQAWPLARLYDDTP